MELDALCLQVANELNDAAPRHEFTSWSRGLVLSFIFDALRVLYQERSELFEKRVILTVTSEGVSGGCGCTKYDRVWGQSDANGNILWPLRERVDDVKNVWTGARCSVSPNNFKLKSYSISDNGTDLRVYPSPPRGYVFYILATCTEAPTEEETNSVDDELVPAVIQWALFKAKMMDAENNPAIFNTAVTHQNTFWALVNRQINKETGDENRIKSAGSR